MHPEHCKSDIGNHLTEEELALWAEASEGGRISELPEKLLTHVEHCLECKQHILAVCLAEDELKLQPSIEMPVSVIRTKFRTRPLFARMAAMAVILVTAGSILFFIVNNRVNDPDTLFKQNFTPYADLVTEKGEVTGSDTTMQLLITGMGYYRREQFDSAVRVFRILNEKPISSDTVAFYLANSILASNQEPGEAVGLLTKMVHKETIFKDPAQWYLALAFLKSHNAEMAKRQLAILVNTSESYRKKAQSLMDSIN